MILMINDLICPYHYVIFKYSKCKVYHVKYLYMIYKDIYTATYYNRLKGKKPITDQRWSVKNQPFGNVSKTLQWTKKVLHWI